MEQTPFLSISTNKPQIFGQASKKIPFYSSAAFLWSMTDEKSFDKIYIFSPEEFFCYAQPTGLILVSFSKSFDISLTFAFFSGTLFHNKAALLNESYYIALFVRSAASPSHFAAFHPRQNLLVLRGLFLSERLAAGQPVCNSSYVL